MRKISVRQLTPGMICGEDIYDFDRNLLLKKDTQLTAAMIEKLITDQVIAVKIVEAAEAPATENKVAAPSAPLSYSERIKQSEEFAAFKAEYELNVDSFRNALNNVVEKNVDLDVADLLQNSLNMISVNRGKVSLLDMLQNMREYDDSTFTHCMNVALISNVLATWLKLSPEDVEMATACGLFHDIGKLKIPHQIITKPGKLSEEEYREIRKHTIAGYKLLQSKHADEHIQNAALMHHERNDGTGYPLQLKGNQIDRFACIVSIADVYDAMTAARCYRGALCPFTVIEIFEKEGLQKYESQYVLTFLERVVDTYLQNTCRLSDGREALIVFINKDKLSRPTVLCEGKYINLGDYADLKIECIL